MSFYNDWDAVKKGCVLFVTNALYLVGKCCTWLNDHILLICQVQNPKVNKHNNYTKKLKKK